MEYSRFELKQECDYHMEAEKQMKYYGLFSKKEGFAVPKVIEELSTKHVLTMEYLEGIDMNTCRDELPQELRDSIGARILDLTIREIFQAKFMQTDPNPANFFYNVDKDEVNLLDFGAARGYSDDFVHHYLKTVYGASENDSAMVLKATTHLGF